MLQFWCIRIKNEGKSGIPDKKYKEQNTEFSRHSNNLREENRQKKKKKEILSVKCYESSFIGRNNWYKNYTSEKYSLTTISNAFRMKFVGWENSLKIWYGASTVFTGLRQQRPEFKQNSIGGRIERSKNANYDQRQRSNQLIKCEQRERKKGDSKKNEIKFKFKSEGFYYYSGASTSCSITK